MRKIVIFTMILTLIFGTVGCTAHSKPDKKAIENSSTNAVIDTTQSEELTEKTESEAVEKSTFAEETTQTTTAEIGTEKVPNETIFSQTTTANTEPKQDTHTQTEPPKSEKSEPEITTNTVSEVTTAIEQIEEFDINYWISYAQNYAQSIAQIKQKCGIIERENYNKPKSEDAKQPQCPPDKEKAIKEALQHFGMI